MYIARAILVVAICIPAWFVVAQTFVVEKKKKEPSVADYQQQREQSVSDGFALAIDVGQNCAECGQLAAQMQRLYLHISHDLLENNAVWVTTKDKKALQECCARLDSCKRALQEMQTAMTQVQKTCDDAMVCMEQVCQKSI